MESAEIGTEGARTSRTGTEAVSSGDAVDLLVRMGSASRFAHPPSMRLAQPVLRWFDESVHSIVLLSSYEGPVDSEMRLMLCKGRFEFDLGVIPSVVTGGCRVTYPIKIDLSKYRLSHLVSHSFRIDGRLVSSWRRHDIVYVDESGMIADLEDSCSAVFDVNFTPFRGTKMVPFNDRGHVRTIDWDSFMNIRFLHSGTPLTDQPGYGGVPEEEPPEDEQTGGEADENASDEDIEERISKTEPEPEPEEPEQDEDEPADTEPEEDERRLGYLRFSGGGLYLDIPSMPMPRGTRRAVSVNADDAVYSCGFLEAFSRRDFSKPRSLDLSGLGIPPNAWISVTAGGEEIFFDRSLHRMFDAGGRITRDSGEARTLVMTNGDWVDFKGARDITCNRTDSCMIYTIPESSMCQFGVVHNRSKWKLRSLDGTSSGTGEVFFPRYRPELMYSDGSVVLRVPRFSVRSGACGYTMKVDGNTVSEGTREVLDSDGVRIVDRFDIDLTEADLLGEMELFVNGQSVFRQERSTHLFFNNSGKMCLRPCGEILAVYHDDYCAACRKVEIGDVMHLGHVVFMAMYVNFGGSVWIGPCEECTEPSKCDLPEGYVDDDTPEECCIGS